MTLIKVTRTRAFTLTELLIVIVIVFLLAALTFGLVRHSIASARLTDEQARMRQIYLAVNLYEYDHDQNSPENLAILSPSYVPESSLSCPQDHRKALGPQPDWPTNIWVNIAQADPLRVIAHRSQHMVSYAYLKPFSYRFPNEEAFSLYRNDPNAGLLTGLGILTCEGGDNSKTEEGGCIYNHSRGTYHPALNLSGTFLTVKSDGSSRVRHLSRCSSNTQFGQVDLFLDLTDINCEFIKIRG